MTRSLLNFWLDTILLVTFLAGIWVEMMVRVVFPPGTTADGWRLWSMTFDQWCELRFWLLAFLSCAVLLHVMLHWSWVCGLIGSKFLHGVEGKKRQFSDGERTLLGVGLLVILFAILGAGLAAAMFTVRIPGA